MRWSLRPSGSQPTILVGKRAQVWAKSGGRCWYCARRIDPLAFHIDHIVPRARGGADALANLAPACAACNLRKGARDLETFRLAEERRLGRTPGRLGRLLGRRYRFWFERRGLNSKRATT